MTAEIAILNKHGIALAADSAVSIGSPQDTKKIYNSANKLFMLSKHCPVAIMVYGGGSFIGVPWEIIVKEYRAQLVEQSFRTLREYAENFWQYMTNNRRIFSESEERLHVQQKINTRLLIVRDEALNKVEEDVARNPTITDEEYVEGVINRLRETISFQISRFEQMESLVGFTVVDGDELLVQYDSYISESTRFIFENIYEAIDPELHTAIRELVKLVFIKKDFDQYSGIVIAGYGIDEIYPRIASYRVGIMLNGKPRLMELEDTSNIHDQEFRPAIIPFAQDEVVRTFLTGIDPTLEQIFNLLQENLASMVTTNLSSDFLNPAMSEVEARTEIQTNIQGYITNLSSVLDQARRDTVLQPIMDMLEYLPKDELAEMAETLVNLTAFRRKMSNSLESVGGPIDVAIISKGDGFIWFKRKHYFQPALNQHFFSNYYAK